MNTDQLKIRAADLIWSANLSLGMKHGLLIISSMTTKNCRLDWVHKPDWDENGPLFIRDLFFDVNRSEQKKWILCFDFDTTLIRCEIKPQEKQVTISHETMVRFS